AQRRAFELETFAEGSCDVARGAAKAEHRVFFLGLVALAAKQLAVFVRLEVRKPHDHGLGPERASDRGDALDHLLDEERAGIGIAASRLGNLAPELRPELVVLEAGARMNADLVVDDEFEPRETDAGIWQLRELECELRIADVHGDLHRDAWHVTALAARDLERHQALEHAAGIAFGAGDRDRLAILQPMGRLAGTDDGRDAEL